MKLYQKILLGIGIFFVTIAVIVILFIQFYPVFGENPSTTDQEEYAKRTEAFYDGTFHGDPEISVMNDQKSIYKDEQTTPNGEVPINELDHIDNASIEDLQFTWFGHSSSLLQMQGLNVLIDPVFSDYGSPVQGFGPKRYSKLPIDVDNLPDIDILVISHDHYDHLDYQTIKDIDSKVKEYCVPLGVENHLIRWGVDESKIHPMAWYDEVNINGLTVISTPGRHYTGRLPWQSNTTLWCGYAFKNEQYTAYYTGDTGYGDFFEQIHERIGDVDFLILEDGQYDLSWQAIHMLPEEGIKVAEIMNAKWTVPVHWGAFSLAYHAWDDPIIQSTTLAKEKGINMATPLIGEIVNYNNIDQYQTHWWEDVD